MPFRATTVLDHWPQGWSFALSCSVRWSTSSFNLSAHGRGKANSTSINYVHCRFKSENANKMDESSKSEDNSQRDDSSNDALESEELNIPCYLFLTFLLLLFEILDLHPSTRGNLLQFIGF